ncbi:hypothetical protein [Thermoactinomyces mirandus]|uniref:Uncharacterized protein n=1 Tax=Thermoactinomyces mirandus TaxID=2756294 RepID=A0A7W2AQA7_9BACL|nr:hypothetical protein [Thermoactinomyces mirandus]MBA4601313.1 hypothetical protein [Thermoactinomyces mirandus]
MKEREVKSILRNMKVGEPIHFSTTNTDEQIEVERVFVGLEEGWLIIYQGERKVLKNLNDAVSFLSKHWNLDLKHLLRGQYEELNEMIDLGKY